MACRLTLFFSRLRRYSIKQHEHSFFLTDPLLSDHYLEATEKGWTGYSKSIPLNKLDLMKNVRFDRLHANFLTSFDKRVFFKRDSSVL